MACKNCLNFKIRRLNYSELVKKWDELYYPNGITPGHKNKMLKESKRINATFEEISFRYIYCSAGVLTRFYIVRGSGVVRPKPGIDRCEFYE
jgi:hypothetical protein